MKIVSTWKEANSFTADGWVGTTISRETSHVQPSKT